MFHRLRVVTLHNSDRNRHTTSDSAHHLLEEELGDIRNHLRKLEEEVGSVIPIRTREAA